MSEPTFYDRIEALLIDFAQAHCERTVRHQLVVDTREKILELIRAEDYLPPHPSDRPRQPQVNKDEPHLHLWTEIDRKIVESFDSRSVECFTSVELRCEACGQLDEVRFIGDHTSPPATLADNLLERAIAWCSDQQGSVLDEGEWPLTGIPTDYRPAAERLIADAYRRCGERLRFLQVEGS